VEILQVGIEWSSWGRSKKKKIKIKIKIKIEVERKREVEIKMGEEQGKINSNQIKN